MSGKIRVFISSTMKDLGNERRAVVSRVKELNLEPVNAEGLLPNGGTSWQVLENEIASSHLFVLILGERYGWIPTEGYGAGTGCSVTHLETKYARKIGLPVLPFAKELKYGADSTSDDAVLRDRFREEVADWSSGGFQAEFEWADELADKAGAALIGLFQDTYLKSLVRSVDERRRTANKIPEPAPIPTPLSLRLAPAFLNRSAVLIAGAGFSIAAGYPSASALAEILGRELGLSVPGEHILNRHRFTEIAALAEERLGRKALIDVVQEAMNTAQKVGATQAHRDSVRVFPVIITTNYDLLFEQACYEQGIDFAVSTYAGETLPRGAAVTIYKVDGSIDQPESLALTDGDVMTARGNPAFWNAVRTHVRERPVAVVGHSMRDTATRWIMEARRRDTPGVFVTPMRDPVYEFMLKKHGLALIEAYAWDFMAALVAQMKN